MYNREYNSLPEKRKGPRSQDHTISAATMIGITIGHEPESKGALEESARRAFSLRLIDM
jgi:hypothetical protein